MQLPPHPIRKKGRFHHFTRHSTRTLAVYLPKLLRIQWPARHSRRAWSWFNPKRLIQLPHLIQLRKPARPFFNALHELLDSREQLTLGHLLDEAGEQSWGLTVLALALFTFVPGVANVVSLATIVVGVQMLWGSPHPWLPKKAQTLTLHKSKIKDLLAAIEKRLAWFAKRRGEKRTPSQRFIGFLIAWTAFIAALPIPIPFANALPAAALILYGVALLEEWPEAGWMGVLLTLGTTIYFAFFFELALHAMKALFRGTLG